MIYLPYLSSQTAPIAVGLATESDLAQAVTASSPPSSVTLNFEGATAGPITNFYDTAPQDYNIVFSDRSAVISAGHLSPPDGPMVLYQNSNSAPAQCRLNITSGSVDGTFSFMISSSQNVQVLVHDAGSNLIYDVLHASTGGTWQTKTIIYVGSATQITFVGSFGLYVIDKIILTITP